MWGWLGFVAARCSQVGVAACRDCQVEMPMVMLSVARTVGLSKHNVQSMHCQMSLTETETRSAFPGRIVWSHRRLPTRIPTQGMLESSLIRRTGCCYC